MMWDHIAVAWYEACASYAKERALARRYLLKPCDYCGRTKQTPTHRTCDGCGAEKPYSNLEVEEALKKIEDGMRAVNTVLPGAIR